MEHPEPTLKMKCSKCSRPRVIGSRCFQDWLRRIAKIHHVSHYQWWIQHFYRVQGMLLARFTVAQMGVEMTPAKEFIMSIWKTDPRPRWSSHKENIEDRSYQSVLKIVAAVDARGKESKHEDDRCHEESR